MNIVLRNVEQNDTRIGTRIRLSALWIALMLVYVYADIISLLKPGVLEGMMAGRMGPFPVTQGSLLAAALLMAIPAAMVFLSLTLGPGFARWANIVLGVLYTLVNINNGIGETWAYYLLFVALELALSVLIVASAWRWRPAEEPAAVKGDVVAATVAR